METLAAVSGIDDINNLGAAKESIRLEQCESEFEAESEAASEAISNEVATQSHTISEPESNHYTLSSCVKTPARLMDITL